MSTIKQIKVFNEDTELEELYDIEDPNPAWIFGTGEHSVQTKDTGATAVGAYTVAEGINTVAAAAYSHTEGITTKTLVAEGDNPNDPSQQPHSWGSHVEGVLNNVKGAGAHAEGAGTHAYNDEAHAEGLETNAYGEASHAEGQRTLTTNFAEHAEGNQNVSNHNSDTYGDPLNTQHSIGITRDGHTDPQTGIYIPDRKNAWEIMQNGDAYLIGIGDYNGTNPSDAKTLQEYMGDLFEDKSDKSTIITLGTTFEAADNTEYRFGEAASLTMTFPATIPDRFDVFISFTSGTTATAFTFPTGIKWSGDDITDGEFVPAASKRYNIALWYDGAAVNGIVRGVV